MAAGALMPCRRSRAGWGGTAGGHQLAPAPPDFPAPVVTDRQSPLFDAGQVVDWLVSTGRKHLPELTVELRLHLLTAPGGQRAPMPPTTMLAAVTALICLRYLDDEPLASLGDTLWRVVAAPRDRVTKVDQDDQLLRAEIEALGPEQGVLAARRRFGGAELHPDGYRSAGGVAGRPVRRP